MQSAQQSTESVKKRTDRAEKKPDGSQEAVQWILDRKMSPVPDNFGKPAAELIRAKGSLDL